jgi:hypothetical protein
MPLRRLSPILALLTVLFPLSALAAPSTAKDAALALPPAKAAGFAAPAPPQAAAPAAAMVEDQASLGTASNAQAVLTMLKIDLSPDQQRFLEANTFLLVPKRDTVYAGQYDFGNCAYQESYDEMLGMFDQICGDADPMGRLPQNTRFVGPDVVLHAMGKYFENALEYLEKTELAPRLARFVAELRARALVHKNAASGELANRLETVAAQLTVPLVLLENVKPVKAAPANDTPRSEDVPDKADTLASALKRLKPLTKDFPPQTAARLEAEIKLVYAAKDLEVSPLFGGYDPEGVLRTDYSQYLPRGHYAKNSLLRGYFRAMMFLGRTGWPLEKPAGLADALLVVRLEAEPGRDGKPLTDSWRRIMDVTGFFAGMPDDTDYTALRELTVRVLGRDSLSLAEAVDPAVLGKLGARLDELPRPRLLADVLADPAIGEKTKKQLLDQTRSFRLFGQRFSPDAWILSRLTAGREKTDLRLPSMPTALFVPAALGNATARDCAAAVLAGPGQGFSPAEVAAFLGRLDATAKDLARIPDPGWYASLASAWLRVLSSLNAAHGQGWPAYMQSPPFPAKRLETILGSYTELKHATLLYAKQNYAEAGSGEEEGTPPPVPKGFVEPDPAFWAAMLRLVDTAMAGFSYYKLLPEELEEYGRLASFRKDMAFYAALAAKELANEPISETDYERLRTGGLSYMTRPFAEVVLEPDQCKSGLTADIHTDAVTGQVLYEATAEPYVMLVLVGNEGSPRLTVGTAYNHYEFARPLADGRLTDQAWQADAYAKPPRLPEKNGWYTGLMVK